MKTINKPSAKTAVKARAYNAIRTMLYKKVYKLLKPEEKEQMFQAIFDINMTAHNEIIGIDWTKRQKRKIHAARVARGYKFKKRISKAEWEKKQAELVKA